MEPSKIEISVVIPAYRAASFIDRAIDSALSQTGVAVEVIVVDDACPIGTGDAVEARYAGKDRLRVVRLSKNGGPAVARNAGFAAARGDWIAVLDADDAFMEGRLGRLLEQACAHQADVVADNICFYNAPLDKVSGPQVRSVLKPTQIDIHKLVDRGRPGTGELDFGLLKPMFSRAFVSRLLGPYPADIRHGEDFVLYCNILQSGGRFFVTPEPGYLWTLRSSGNSQTQIDYESQAEFARAQGESARRSGDAQLASLFGARADALHHLHYRHQIEKHMKARRPDALLGDILRYPPAAKMIAQRLWLKVRR